MRGTFRIRRATLLERGLATNIYNKFIVPEEYKSVIRAHNWEVFCAPPISAIIPIVREFYASASQHDYTWEATVRGKIVKFDRTDINDFFNLPTLETDDYMRLQDQLCEESTWDTILQALTPPDTQWMFNDTNRVGFPFNLLSREKRVWLYFICSNLTPTKAFTIVTSHKVVLLYAVLNNKSIDVGSIILAVKQNIVLVHIYSNKQI